MSLRLYLSGPINSPIPDVTPDQCRARFYKAAAIARERWEFVSVVNPLEVPAECLEPGGVDKDGRCGGPFDGHEYQCWMRGDLKAMLDCDSILLLPGWTQSRGARLQQRIAEDLGLHPYFMHPNMEGML